MPDFIACASRNREVFEDVLEAYVSTKLGQVLSRLEPRARSGWFDASGCVWCLFDDERFERVGDAGRRLCDERGEGYPLQVYWSMGDVVMPQPCDERWVAERIAAEARRQLNERGYRCVPEERLAEGSMHLGVRFRKRLLAR